MRNRQVSDCAPAPRELRRDRRFGRGVRCAFLVGFLGLTLARTCQAQRFPAWCEAFWKGESQGKQRCVVELCRAPDASPSVASWIRLEFPWRGERNWTVPVSIASGEIDGMDDWEGRTLECRGVIDPEQIRGFLVLRDRGAKLTRAEAVISFKGTAERKR